MIVEYITDLRKWNSSTHCEDGEKENEVLHVYMDCPVQNFYIHNIAGQDKRSM